MEQTLTKLETDSISKFVVVESQYGKSEAAFCHEYCEAPDEIRTAIRKELTRIVNERNRELYLKVFFGEDVNESD
jgi:hypothetical protein